MSEVERIIAALRCEGNCDGCKYYVSNQDEHTGEVTDCCNDGLLHKDAVELIEQFYAALRAQEQNEPLTCDGCKHDGSVSAYCEGCIDLDREQPEVEPDDVRGGE